MELSWSHPKRDDEAGGVYLLRSRQLHFGKAQSRFKIPCAFKTPLKIKLMSRVFFYYY